MDTMTRERPRGLFARFGHLVRSTFGGWLRRSERRNPAAVYEQAIEDRTQQYRDLKEAVAGILYMRNKLEAEIGERRVEIARLHDDVRTAIRRGREELSLTLIENKQRLLEDLERSERELEGVRNEAEEAKNNLVRFREEIRSLTREKGRMLATLANANARRRLNEALEGLSVDADMRALEGVRDYIARAATEGDLDRELSGSDDQEMRHRLRAIRDDARHEAARRELAEIKRDMGASVLEPGEPVAAPVGERLVPVVAG
ncbi:MAG: PspA/IM30 family protein [Myxococcota bacterium]